jgi:hypothetical protein
VIAPVGASPESRSGALSRAPDQPGGRSTESLAPTGTDSQGSNPGGESPGAVVRPQRLLLALGMSLVGFIGVAVLLYGTKYLGAGPTIFDLPSRDLFVFSLLLAVAPLVLAIFQKTSLLFLVPSIALVFLLYPLFSPFGLPYDRDVIFNFQFANVLLETGHWVPGGGVSGTALAYAYYPGSGVYNAEFSAVTGAPLYTSIQWSTPLFRLLVLPPAIYALGQRLFGARVGMLGLLLYMGTPSILFNIPVQQEFAVPFFVVTFLLLAFWIGPPSRSTFGLVAALVLCGGFIVVSHHLTSYATLVWLSGFLLLSVLLARRDLMRWPRAAPFLGAYALVFVAFTYFVSGPQFLQNVASLKGALAGLSAVRPGSLTPAAAGVGQSFPLYQQVWVYGAFLLLVVGALLGLRAYHRGHDWGFAGINVIVALLITLGTIPFLATEFSFLVLRVLEFSGIFLAPMTAWWLLERLGPWLSRRVARRRVAAALPRLPRLSGRRHTGAVVTVAIVALVFTGGSLAPYSSRDQFAPASQILNDSPVLVDPYDYALGNWAHEHLNTSSLVWGDFFTFSVIGGFGRFNLTYDQYIVFNGSTVSSAAWSKLAVGEYIVIEPYMTTKTPSFYGPASDQPKGPLSEAQVTKFNDPTYFDRVYNDAAFSIYEVIRIG